MKKFLFFVFVLLFSIVSNAQSYFSGGMNTPPVTPATLPYLCNFEDPNENAQWVLSNSTNISKWYTGTPTNNQLPISGGCLYVSSDNGVTASYDVNNAGTVVATRTIEFNGANQYLLNFDLFIGGESSYDYLKVFLVDVDSNFVGVAGSTYPNYALNTYTTNQLLTNYAGTAPYFNGYNGLIIVSGSYPREIVIPNQGPAGTMKKLVFVWKNDGSTGTMPPATIDNISLIVPSCPSPSTPVVSNILPNSVDLSWTENGIATQWLIEYKLASETNWNNASSTVASNTASSSLTGLLSNTNYNARIKAVCGSGNESLWLYTSFLTSCDPFVTIPFSDFFDNYVSGSFPQCWSKLSSNTNPVVSTSYKSSGPNSMYMYTASGVYNYLVMPTIDPSVSLNSLSAYFRLYKTTTAYNITVGVMSDPTNSATFDSIVNLTPSATSTWQFFSVNFANYTGTGRYIAFKVQGFGAANGMYIDDFTVMETPSCNIPTGLTRNSATYNSMELDWNSTDDANCTGWIVEYKPYDDQVWLSAYTTSHPFTISNLVSNVVYRISVKAVCVSGDTTLATDIANYGLPCEPITYFPWEEGFEDVWFTGNGYGGTADSRPWCWFNVNGGASASYKWQRTTTASYVRSGLASMQMYASNTYAQLGDWMITPVFTFTGNERVKFWAKGYSTYSDDLSVKIFDAATNGVFDANSDTSLFATIMPNTIISATDWTEYEINLSQFVGDYQIAFVRNTTGGYYLNIDDLSISALPTCLRPSNVSLNYITDTEAQISWTPGNPNDAAWWFYYKPATANTYDSVHVTQASYILQNLTVNTAYSVYVRTDCGAELSEPTSPKTIRTASCAAIATIPWSDSFDSYGTGSTIFPTCWTNKSTSTSYPYVNTTNNSAPGSMYFYATSGYNLALTPSISSTIPVNTLRANFKLKMSSSSYKISVGVMSDPNDLSTFYEMANISTSSTQWNDYEVNFSTYTGQGTYIAFKVYYLGTTMTIYMDDLVISELPLCAKPTQLTSSNLTTTSVDINWLPGNVSDASWWLYWKQTSATTYDSLLISSNPYTLPNLNANTYYQVYLKTDCGAEVSQPSDILTFKTPCEAITTIPYTENFDTYGTTAGVFPGCWFRPILYSSTPYPSIVNAYSVSSPTSLRFQSASATQPTYAITPQIDQDINTLRVLFKLKAESITSSGTMQVGVMSDPNNVATFEVVETIVPTSTSFTNYEVFFNNTTLTGTGKYIAFKHLTSSSSYYYWLDDVVVDYIPSCVRPLQVAAHDSTQTSVEISWVPFNISDGAWWLYYKPSSATSFDSVQVFASPYTLTNLNPSTVYQYYMRTDCGTELSEPTNIYTFNTQCGNIVSLPFSDNFDSYATGTSVMPICWTRINTYTSGDRPYVSTGGRVANCLYFFTGTAGTYNIAVMPPIDPSIAINTLRVKFYAKNYSSTDRMVIGVMSDPTLASTFEPVDTIAPTSAWLPYEVNLNNYVGLGTHIAFKNEYTTTSSYGYIDDLEIDYIPSCLKPTQITASNITLNSADISWTPGNVSDNAWWIYWQPINGTTLDSVYVTSMPYQLAGLQASTIYKVYIKTDCGSDLSEFSTLFSFSTLCGQITQLPYTESFDYYGTTAGVFPTCWFRPILNTTTPFPSIVSANVVSSPGSLKFQSTSSSVPTFAVTPELNLDINTLRVVFKLKAESTTSSGTMHVGVMSDPTDTSTFELVQIITPTSTSYTEYEIFFANTTLSGTGNHIAFKHVTNASNYFYWLDDVVVDLIPACAKPTQILASNITTSNANISWVPGYATDNSWWIYWKPTTASTYDSLLISSNPYTLTNLLTNTFYQVYLKTDCGSEISQASSILTFKTPCDAVTTIPYTENFDSYGIATGTFPSCWFRPVLNGTTPFPSIVDAYSVSTPASLKFQSASATVPT
ncbi:MAG: choice-of-anchor J domain-containing protein, partial [Bacteroidales bacterium]|nr:choice-of-anchor J domain-containing protein [Bacteroidales bacterium]